ncbi:MAG: S24 family peptidase [bacterium]|nr:S24 family peptidase [bacterium]
MADNREITKNIRHSRVTGFPSPADDFLEGRLDLNELLVEHPAATFYMRVEESNVDLAVVREDILIIDRSLEPVGGNLVVAISDGELCLHRFSSSESVSEGLEVWGVVRAVIHPTLGTGV